jgi:hypothetical protein
MDNIDEIDFEEKRRVEEEIKEAKKEARKEVKEEKKVTGRYYKFSLRGC